MWTLLGVVAAAFLSTGIAATEDKQQLQAELTAQEKLLAGKKDELKKEGEKHKLLKDKRDLLAADYEADIKQAKADGKPLKVIEIGMKRDADKVLSKLTTQVGDSEFAMILLRDEIKKISSKVFELKLKIATM
jgi:hypothetical protein